MARWNCCNELRMKKPLAKKIGKRLIDFEDVVKTFGQSTTCRMREQVQRPVPLFVAVPGRGELVC